MSNPLLPEFPTISREEWLAVISADFKGADIEKSLVKTNLDGIRVWPFHRADDLPSQLPGALWSSRTPHLREEIREPDLSEANAHAHRALERGADQITFLNYPIGPSPVHQEGMQQLLDGLWGNPTPIHWQCGPLSAHVLAMLMSEARWRDVSLEELRGSVDLDPILDRCAGFVDAPLASWRDEAVRRAKDILANFPNFGLFMVRGAFIEKAGATIAQEIAFSLAIFNDYLSVLTAEFPTCDLKKLVEKCEIRLAVGTSFFFEMSKLRAIRLLLPNLLAAHGVEGAMPNIHVTATSSNKTVYDPYNNMLRGTIEGMAMLMGGADSMTLSAYDQAYHTPDEFSEHLARNTHTLMQQEAKLADVGDPLAGSYTVEWLTHAYADAAWKMLLEIEGMGGFVGAWESGWVASELERARSARADAVRKRKRTIVGTTAYGNPQERRLQDIQDRPVPKQVRPYEGTISALVDEFLDAGSIDQWISDAPVPSTALDPFRVSWPYEHARLRTEKFGKRPRILLALFGDPKWRNARSAFCQHVLAAAGYDYSEQIVGTVNDLQLEGFDAVLLCSEDAAYQSAYGARSWPVPVLIAGPPEPAIAGVTAHLHARQPLDEALNLVHGIFGVPDFGPEKEVTR